MRFCLIVFMCVVTFFEAKAQKLVTLGLEDVSVAVVKEFAEQGIEEDVELEIFGGKTAFALEGVEDAKIMISGLVVNEEQNKFSAKAEIFADGVSKDSTELVGRYYLVKKVWVPAKDIAKDELIKEEDLVLQNQRMNRIKKDSLTTKEDLLGKQALKLLKEGKLIAQDDVCDEIVVQKGETVMVVYQYKGLQITAKMEALENGSKGQNIKLINNKSGKEIIGKVIAERMVEIVAE